MTYLEMCKAAYRLIGELDTLSSVTTATGFQNTVCLAVQDAWLDIQRRRPDWNFLRSNSTVTVDSTKQVYNISTDWGITDFGKWDKDMLIYNDRSLIYSSYDYFMTKFGYENHTLYFDNGITEVTLGTTITGGTSGSTGISATDATVSAGAYATNNAEGYYEIDEVTGDFTVGEDIEVATVKVGEVVSVTKSLGNSPHIYTVEPSTKDLIINNLDDTYRLKFHYFVSPETLTTNTQEPSLPDEFHMVIVYSAVRDLAVFLGESVLEKRYSRKFSRGLQQLMRGELPPRRVIKRPIA